ncbi:TonB-dependent receptor [Silvimonas iriomotensis]|uniref:TonB-dependent receptor n=1 Tax=Silvimonas iriomotensis TaxID=449662 RepID=A0ABQ2P9A4_9NEIS|nr:TonB-dependent receptor [Silvimonas iriomotensis]GGP21083.1 TonB-dependent receptor [Silvimonas iriomotensis]
MFPFPLRPLALLLAGCSLPQLALADNPATAAEIPVITVTAERLKNARIELSPDVGTTVYHIDRSTIDSFGRGDAAAFDQVLLRLPGVDADSKGSGSLHVRDDHGNVQYRVDGVQLPEAISGFGSAFDTRYVDSLDFLTGALPAQYGLRTAGVVDIQTRSGPVAPGGRVGVEVGSHDTVAPSAALFGSAGRLNYYLSGSYLSSAAGLENPQPTRNPLHDDTWQSRSFGNLQYFVDEQTRVGLLFGTYNGRYEIPANPDQAPAYALAGVSDPATGLNNYPSSQVDERQREVNRFVAVSFQQNLDTVDYQLSVFHQYSDLHFYPDQVGDLVYNGVASDTFRSNSANGLQLDAAWRVSPAHTLRAGGQLQRQGTASNNAVSVFAVDDTGAQTSNVPFTIVDNSSKTGTLVSVYAQDEWRLSPVLTLNYGLRFDEVSAFTQEHQFSPRINLAWQASDNTLIHAGYSRYFTPPPQELASQSSIDLYSGTTNQPAVSTSDSVKAERTHYFDIGASHKLTPALTLALDAYYKRIRNLLDEGQFGQALILSPFNYEQGYARGVEFSATWGSGPWNGYLNVAYQKAQGKHIVSGQSLFDPDELAYIANHDIYLDHDQTWTASSGVSYRFGQNLVSGDMLFGSGLRRTPDGGAPNSASLPSYTVFNTAYTHTWKTASNLQIEGRLALLNVFDHVYLLRDGTGVGVGAPQYGARRSVYGSVTTTF